MAYVVDGNNVMGQTPGWHRDRPRARNDLLRRLAAFAGIKKARLTVVFDGVPDRNVPEGSGYRGVRVLYAGTGSDADTRIESLVESSNDRRGLTVVTSDRRLASTVRAMGASVLRSGQFRRHMEDTIRLAPPSSDAYEDVGDVDEWLKYFRALPEDDEA